MNWSQRALLLFLAQPSRSKDLAKSRNLLAETTGAFLLTGSYQTFKTSWTVQGNLCSAHFYLTCAHNLRKAVADIPFVPGHFHWDFNLYHFLQTVFWLEYPWHGAWAWHQFFYVAGPPTLFVLGKESAWHFCSVFLWATTSELPIWVPFISAITEVPLLPGHPRSGLASIMYFHSSKRQDLGQRHGSLG